MKLWNRWTVCFLEMGRQPTVMIVCFPPFIHILDVSTSMKLTEKPWTLRRTQDVGSLFTHKLLVQTYYKWKIDFLSYQIIHTCIRKIKFPLTNWRKKLNLTLMHISYFPKNVCTRYVTRVHFSLGFFKKSSRKWKNGWRGRKCYFLFSNFPSHYHSWLILLCSFRRFSLSLSLKRKKMYVKLLCHLCLSVADW